MPHVLHLDSSAGGEHSFSRLLGRELISEWSRRDPEMVLTYRDLDAEPLEFVNSTWVAAAFTPPEQRDSTGHAALTRSDQLLAELDAADVLVIGAPMYNFGIPASLKAWIDQVVRLGRTFGYDGPTPIGLVSGKRVILLATSGGDAIALEQAGLDHRTSYLQAILGFVGMTDIEVVSLVGTAGEPLLDEARLELYTVLERQLSRALVPAQG